MVEPPCHFVFLSIEEAIIKPSVIFAVVAVSAVSISCEKALLGPEKAISPPPVFHASRFATILDSLRYALDLPALAGAIVTDSGIVEAEAVGCRRYGGAMNVTMNDKFHLGSCSKAFTAAVLAALVDDGLVEWETNLLKIFPEYSSVMRPEYRDVTVRNLLSHGAGFIRDADFNLKFSSNSPREQRAEVVKWALQQQPATSRGQYLYSNLGYTIAGAIAEKLANGQYEDLVMERLVRPLGLLTAGIGAMGTPGLEDQPLQHTPGHAPIIPTADAHLNVIYNPAGMLHMSVVDWAKYVEWVLACEAGHQTLLSPGNARALTTPAIQIGTTGFYALGWGGAYYENWAGGKSLNHSESNGFNYASAALAPARHFGILVMTNQGAVGSDWLLGPAILRLIDYRINGY